MRRLLITGTGYTPDQFRRLSACNFEIHHYDEIPHEELQRLLPTIDVHILGGSERLDAAALACAGRLRMVSFVGTGYGAFVDEAAAIERKIVIASTPGVASPAVAEHTVGLLIGLARHLFAQNEGVKRSGLSPMTASEIASMTIGIVGMGEIGHRVARILTIAFGSRVCYTSRSRKPEVEEELSLTFMDIASLFASCNAVILLVPTMPETRHMISTPLLSTTRPGMLLINTAGAALVDPVALKQAIDSGIIAAAGFDGYWIEPLPAPSEDPFGFLDQPDSRFVITPHTAAKTVGTWTRMVERAVSHVVDEFEGKAFPL